MCTLVFMDCLLWAWKCIYHSFRRRFLVAKPTKRTRSKRCKNFVNCIHFGAFLWWNCNEISKIRIEFSKIPVLIDLQNTAFVLHPNTAIFPFIFYELMDSVLNVCGATTYSTSYSNILELIRFST